MTTDREEPHWDRCRGAYSNCSWLTPAERSTWGMRTAMVVLHVILVGGVFLLDRHLIEEARLRPWYIALYLLLFILTVAQYFYTAGSSPGYVIDIMKDKNIAETIMKRASDVISCSTSSMESHLTVHTNEEGYRLPTSNGGSRGKDPAQGFNASEIIQAAASSSSNWSCHYCHIWQPPRSKHCHDCDKCVLGFDHHCMWLGTCIGEGNHCKFWWYIFEETILGIWTSVMYITSFRKSGSDKWLHNFFVILLLIVLLIGLVFLLMLLFFHSYLALTNQTTYEAIRRRRIPYLRGLPDGVHPYSKGAFRNLYLFCCSRNDFYVIEFLPSIEELGTRARPYTFWDILSCHC